MTEDPISVDFSTPETCRDCVREVDWPEVKVKERVYPKMPSTAMSGYGEWSCRIRLFIDEEGVPYDVIPEQCPEVFQESSLDAARKWRFYPVYMDSKAIRSQFVLNIIYVTL